MPDKNDALFLFEWQKDQDGYGIGTVGASGSVFSRGVQGKGGPPRAYRLIWKGLTLVCFGNLRR